jgi:hypothetical protein
VFVSYYVLICLFIYSKKQKKIIEIVKKFFVYFLLLGSVFIFADENVDNLDPWPSKLRLSGGGATRYGGVVILDYLMPVYYSRDKEKLLFFNPKERFLFPFSAETNLGLGFRTILKDKVIVGINYYHDIQYSRHKKWYNQNGVGVELLSHPIDVRFNYYIPSTHAKKIGDTTYELGSINLLMINRWEVPLQGCDFEIGGPILEKYLKTRFYVGGFFYHSNFTFDFNGLRLRSESDIYEWLSLDALLEWPNRGKVNFAMDLRFNIPIYFGKRSNNPTKLSYIKDRLFERVIRDIDIQSSMVTKKEVDSDVNIIYVNNTNMLAGADGSLQKPYPALADAFASSRYLGNGGNANYIYLFKGDGSSYLDHVELCDNVTLWGSGCDGGYKGIAILGHPVIDATDKILGIVAGNNCTIMGVELINSMASGIQIANVSNVCVHNNIIKYTQSYMSISNGAISVISSESDMDNINIYKNICVNNDYVSGVFVQNSIYNYVIKNVIVENNDIHDNAKGITILASNKYGEIRDINILSNQVVNNGVGISLQVDNPVAESFTNNVMISSNFISNNVDGIVLLNVANTAVVYPS